MTHRLLRCFSWNVNGIGPFLQPSIAPFVKNISPSQATSTKKTTSDLRSFLRRHQFPQILGLQEVKISPSDYATQRAIEIAVNKVRSVDEEGPRYKVFYSLPQDQYNARGFGRKLYGVATIVREDFLRDEEATVREVDWDTEGRVLVVETKSKLSIWNIYAVNGTTNAYRDPNTGVVIGTRHDRKLAFHKLLLEECKRLEGSGYQVVLAGDINIAPARIDGFPNLRTKPEQHAKNRADFVERFLDSGTGGLHGVDSFRHLHPNVEKYTYHPRNVDWRTSCNRVDLIIVSRKLVERGVLVEAEILESPGERGPSDHCPHFVALDMSLLASTASTVVVDELCGEQRQDA